LNLDFLTQAAFEKSDRTRHADITFASTTSMIAVRVSDDGSLHGAVRIDVEIALRAIKSFFCPGDEWEGHSVALSYPNYKGSSTPERDLTALRRLE
jgi:hypothetical protein